MMDNVKIDRINALAHKAKSVGLTEEEKKVLNAQRQEIEKQKKTLEETKKKVSARNK